MRFQSFAIFIATTLVVAEIFASTPTTSTDSRVASRPYSSNQMPPAMIMNMQQQMRIQNGISERQYFIKSTEAEISRLDKELQKSINFTQPKLMDSMRRNKRQHEQNLAQAKIDLSVLEKQEATLFPKKK